MCGQNSPSVSGNTVRVGVSETVRHRDAIFLTAIDTVKVLDPRETELVSDWIGHVELDQL